MILSLRARSHAKCVEFYMISYIRAHIFGVGLSNAKKRNFWRRKESYHVLDHLVRDRRWTAVGWPLDKSIITSYPYDLVLLHWFLSGNIFHDFLQVDEILNLRIFQTRWWICESSPYGWHSGCGPHTSSVWPWSSAPKVHLYHTFLGGLRHSPPQMKNQHGLNEGKNHIGKKINLSFECLWCDTCG